MQITINIPTKSDIINGLGVVVSAARNGEPWSKSQLGQYADKSGVYIHHSNGEILYIGKTTKGYHGNFGERLRREFQKKASKNSTLYQLLARQENAIRTYCIELDAIDGLVRLEQMPISVVRKALIMEQALIGVYNPEGNKG
ncbi:MAG: hypothetical protein ACOYOS_12930 [Syntrophales bacterium]